MAARRRRAIHVNAERLEGRVLLAASLLKDINTATDGSNPLYAVSVGASVYFNAFDPTHGYRLWNTDGTAAGTRIVGASSPSPAGTYPHELTAVGNKLFFLSQDSLSGYDGLYVSDGTDAGTTELIPLHSDVYSVQITPDLTAAGGKLFFVFGPQGGAAGLWVSDGTPGGTIPLTGTAGQAGTSVLNVTAVGDLVYFTADDGSGHMSLWKSDGTVGGTGLVADLPRFAATDYGVSHFVGAINRLLFAAVSPQSSYVQELWVSDGTAMGTHSLAGPPDNLTGPANIINVLTAVGNDVLFTARDSTNQVGLWTSDGTVTGSTLISPQDDPTVTALAGNEVFFLNGGLWKTDGTPDGTALLGGLANGDSAFNLAVVGGTAFFIVQDATGYQLWASDGTLAGTRVVSPVHGIGGLMEGGNFAAAGNELFFPVDDGLHGVEPWVSDGTAAGTHLLLDINTAISGSLPTQFTSSNGEMYFSANDGFHGRQLWKTDGTPDGTVRVVDGDLYTNPSNLTDVNGTLYFVASGGLFKTDGTAAGTMGVNGASPNFFSYPTALVKVDGTLYFVAKAKGPELVRTDGTAAGTKLLFSMPQGSSFDLKLVNLDGRLLITINGTLYVMNSRETGYVMLGPAPATPSTVVTQDVNEVIANGIFYYMTRGPNGQATLYRSDGTPAGTAAVAVIAGRSLPPAGASIMTTLDNLVYFVVYGLSGNELWRSDGTGPGTQFVARVASGPFFPQIASFNGAVYYFAATSAGGADLWKTDGSSSGTMLVRDFSGDGAFAALNGSLFFFANDYGKNTQLWVTDGTTADTDAVQGFDPPLFHSSEPTWLTPFQGRLYFAGDNGSGDGTQPWVLDSSGSIAGSVFNDAHNNGVESPDDAPMAGVTVYLDANNDGVLDPGDPTTTTDANGNYKFSDLQPGSFTVREILPAGWRRTTPIDSQLTVRVLFGGAAAGPTFGNVQVSTIPLGFEYLITLARHYGQAGTFATGDLNGDGKVDFADLVLLARNYGHPLTGSAAAMFAASQVPPSQIIDYSKDETVNM